MQSKTSIENKIEEALESLANIKKASPTPFFYTRLMARRTATNPNIWDRLSAFIIRPATVFAGIILVILINIIAALNFNSPASSEQAEVTTADEYTQLATNFYDLENLKP